MTQQSMVVYMSVSRRAESSRFTEYITEGVSIPAWNSRPISAMASPLSFAAAGPAPQPGMASVYPPLERVPRRFAIARRNRWMVDQADVVVACVQRSWGGAAEMLRYAQRRGKAVLSFPPPRCRL